MRRLVVETAHLGWQPNILLRGKVSQPERPVNPGIVPFTLFVIEAFCGGTTMLVEES